MSTTLFSQTTGVRAGHSNGHTANIKGKFGVEVRFWRQHLHISQMELALRSGLHRSYISDVERGTRNISLEAIEQLANALKVDIAELLAFDTGKSCPVR